MKTPKIEDGIPTPKRRSSHEIRYPWGDLEVGQSFFTDRPCSTVGGSVSVARLKYPERKFITRSVIENGLKGTRVWRTL